MKTQDDPLLILTSGLNFYLLHSQRTSPGMPVLFLPTGNITYENYSETFPLLIIVVLILYPIINL